MDEISLPGTSLKKVRAYNICVEIVLNIREVLHSQIQFESGFAATHLLHPATYLNKVLVGGSDGSLQLWNIRTRYVP
jgi:hypothetical protein